jgi:hypothetical protein
MGSNPSPGVTVREQPLFAKTTVWDTESGLAKDKRLPAGISILLGEGPVAVSETKQPPCHDSQYDGRGHTLEALFDGLANSPAAAATAATTRAIAASRLLISVPPSGG